jgi:hypothetical protein
MDDRQYIRISELLLRIYDGSAGREDNAELEALLNQAPEALDYYVETVMNLNYFHCLRQVPLSQPQDDKGLDKDFMSQMSPEEQSALLKDSAEHERYASAIKIAKPEKDKEQGPITKIEYQRPARTINKFSLAVSAICAAALLLMIVYVRLAPPAPYEVATISDCMDAQWSSHLPIGPGTRITSAWEPIRLTHGIVKLRTDDQVQVVLEAPTEFYFKSSSEISMNYGKLFAHVSKTGSGFSVVTPNSKLVDLGTEFGILSQIDGNTEVHLFKGKANLFAGEKNKPKTSQLLTAGSARQVDSQDSNIQEIALDEQALVRNIDSQSKFVWKGQAIRLADLLLGGNGFGTASLQSIEYDPVTGAVVPVGVAGYRNGPGKVVRIRENPYLDCIFVPGSENGDVIVSSAGHRFKECPKTSGLYFSNIICQKNCKFFDSVQKTFKQSRKQFTDSGFLYLHSNIGLTVDLNAVRHVVPGLRISSFSAFAGIIDMWNNEPKYSEVDVWILVDGQVKSFQKALRADQGYDIHVELSDTDRFLTLVVTDGGKIYSEGFPANHFDTCGFADPVFGLASPQE